MGYYIFGSYVNSEVFYGYPLTGHISVYESAMLNTNR